MPIISANVQKTILKNQFKKAYALISNAYRKSEADLGYAPQCFYWQSNPYGSASCVAYNDEGNCTKYQLSDGSSLPSDYNGLADDCTELGEQVVKNLKVIKVCEGNAYPACIPDYAGYDTIKKAADDSLTDYDINKATTGCGNWHKNNLKNVDRAYVLADGQIIISYGNTVPKKHFAIDINGKKGPNKWGYDLFQFSTVGNSGGALKITGKTCSFVETGGTSTLNMIKNMNK